MKLRKYNIHFILLIAVCLLVANCSKDNNVSIEQVAEQNVVVTEEVQEEQSSNEDTTEEAADDDITEISSKDALEYITANEDLSIVADALAYLGGSLDQVFTDHHNQLTLFLPSNTAFVRFFDTLEGYSSIYDFESEMELKILEEILAYHTVNGNVTLLDGLSDGDILGTIQSSDIIIEKEGDGFKIKNNVIEATVVTSDIAVANGVIHIIDQVVLPQHALADLLYAYESRYNAMDVISNTDELSKFMEAIVAAGLQDSFEGNNLTVFAPTNNAIEELFVNLGEDYNAFTDFNSSLEQQALQEIILGHVVAQKIVRSDLEVGELSTLIKNDAINVVQSAAGLALQDASVFTTNFIQFDMEASNGVIHTVDKVLLPAKVLLFSK